jgi:hypothetical protein
MWPGAAKTAMFQQSNSAIAVIGIDIGKFGKSIGDQDGG